MIGQLRDFQDVVEKRRRVLRAGALVDVAGPVEGPPEALTLSWRECHRRARFRFWHCVTRKGYASLDRALGKPGGSGRRISVDS